MNRASNGNLGSRSRKREWTDSVIPSRRVARQQLPRRLGSRQASLRAGDSPGLPVTASSTAIVLSQGRIGDSSFWPSTRSTDSRERPCCGAAVIGTSVRRPGALELDPCEVPPVRFRLPPFARKANGIVAAYKRIRTPVESLRPRELPPSPERRIERSNDRWVAGRWLIARYQGDGVGARRGSLKQPSLALARNQRRGAALALTTRECIEESDQAEMALRMMQL